MRASAALGVGALVAPLLLAGCGAGGHRIASEARTSVSIGRVPSPPAQPRPPTRAELSSRFVFMRRFQPIDGTFQTISINAEGSGVTTAFIGEHSENPHASFRVQEATLMQLQRLVADVAAARHLPSANAASRPAVTFTLEVRGRWLPTVEGRPPGAFGQLVSELDGLLGRYCC